VADFAPNFTTRYLLRYSVVGRVHSQLWRAPSSVTDLTGLAGLISKVGAYYAEMAPKIWSDFSFLSASWAPADSDIFLPASTPGAITGEVSVATAALSANALAISFVGRSDHGEKARMFQYGVAVNPADSPNANDFRIHSSEDTHISSAIGVLNESAPALVANDDHDATFYDYVNVKYNDYWTRKSRT